MAAISSTVIRGAWYLPDARQLDLLFNSGRQYRYSGVPRAVARSFVDATSRGRFYNKEIRNCFPCREIGGERDARLTRRNRRDKGSFVSEQ